MNSNSSKLSAINNSYLKENTLPENMLPDGNYLVNHNIHPEGVREREIIIKNGIVNVANSQFSQSSFFECNHVVKQIN